MESRALFREIHKNTWLKKVYPEGFKKVVNGNKKNDKFWVVFCVHDDFDAMLEGYTEPRNAPSHSPDWTISLQNTLHISHALVPTTVSDQEYEFVITLNNDVFRFCAPTWECMQEWVDTLRSKLREMKILSPKENFYSKLPEIRPPLLPTRDPMSPLPAPPPVPAAMVPGVECIIASVPSTVATTSTSSNAIASTSNSNNNRVLEQPQESPPSPSPTTVITNSSISSDDANFLLETTTISTAMSNTSPQSLINLLSNPIQAYSNSQKTAVENILDNSSASTSRDVSCSSLAKTFTNNVLSDLMRCTTSSLAKPSKVNENNILDSTVLSSSLSSDTDLEMSSMDSPSFEPEPLIIPRPHTSRSSTEQKPINKSTSNNQQTKKNSPEDSPSTNITIIQVSNTPSPTTTTTGTTTTITTSAETFQQQPTVVSVSSSEIFNFNFKSDVHEDENYKSNVQIIPSNPITPQYSTPKKINNKIDVTTVQVSSSPFGQSSSANIVVEQQKIVVSNFSTVTNISVVSTTSSPTTPQHYEQVFLSSSSPLPATNNNIINLPIIIPPNSPILSLINRQHNRSASQTEIQLNRSKSKNLNNKENTKNLDEIQPSTSTGRTSVAVQTQTPVNRPVLTRGQTELVLSRPSRLDKSIRNRKENNQAVEKLRNESHEQRKRSSSTSEATTRDIRRMQQPPQPFRPAAENNQSVGRLTLREQQVVQLRREMMHPGGVRLQLRKKDCIGSIAWIDAFGGVWCAGWKQKEHPMLYNALHIGDQLISIKGVNVSSACDANKMIRGSPGLYIELIVRRIPFGRVYAIRREMEGQCLGLIRDGNSATIVDVVPNSLAARHGLPPKAKTCDGLSLTCWVLTEINGRPLNLFFKENEVRDRLNAVGRDISILVQPSDLFVKLKKQLKSLRGHKDYIVQ